uniref:LAGLIDADG homing endonuclease n=1 Tax=Ulva ohnoi TaxID=240864 RepID=A0A2Z6FBC1_9CHLO|nr:LAGLIDADG homing endonuclease [Ulva ohnoi]
MKKKLKRSAISEPSNIGSSETTREAPLNKKFNFDYYFNNFKPKHIKENNYLFLEWFIGFSEGDGSFTLSNKRCYFSINQKDIKLLYKIKKNLGFGKVLKYTQNNTNYGRYIVQDQQNCERLANIFNGNLVLIKTNVRFKIWIKELNIKPLKTRGQICLNNYWLSGFIDSEGCFYSRVRKFKNMKLGYKVEQKFIINQKGEYELFYCLKNLFSSNANIQKIVSKINKSIYYKIELSSFLSNTILLNYLKKFPCKGNKHLNFLIYRRIYGYIERKEHLTLTGLKKIKILCKKLKK